MSPHPTSVRDADSVRTALLHFGGRKGGRFVVKFGSDRAVELIAAGKALGWVHEGSTPNSKLHNPVAERGIRTSKDGASCNLEQSGLFHKDWPHAQEHHDLVRTFTEPAPSDGVDDPRHGLTKFEAACGRKFDGKLYTFGALVWYKVPPIGLPPFAPKTVPGIFLGWEIQADFRWRGTYKVADYEALRKGNLKVVLVKEIVRPSGKYCYPLANAKLEAIQNFKPVEDVVLPPSSSFAPPLERILPEPPSIAVGQGGLPDREPPAPELPNREPPGLERVADDTRAAKITAARLNKHGPTVGCKACDAFGGSFYDPTCRDRFNSLFSRQMSSSSGTAAPPMSENEIENAFRVPSFGNESEPSQATKDLVSQLRAPPEKVADQGNKKKPWENKKKEKVHALSAHVLVSGAKAAQQAIDDVLEDLTRFAEKLEQDACTSALTKRFVQAAAAAKSNPAPPRPKGRPALKHLYEFACAPDSELGNSAAYYGVKDATDLSDPAVIKRLLNCLLYTSDAADE